MCCYVKRSSTFLTQYLSIYRRTRLCIRLLDLMQTVHVNDLYGIFIRPTDVYRVCPFHFDISIGLGVIIHGTLLTWYSEILQSGAPISAWVVLVLYLLYCRVYMTTMWVVNLHGKLVFHNTFLTKHTYTRMSMTILVQQHWHLEVA